MQNEVKYNEQRKENGINIEQTKVGDRYVLERMVEIGSNLGGEQSGHIIFRKYATTGDGQLSGAMLASVIKASGKSASEVASVMTVLPQTLVNVTATPEMKALLKTDDDIKNVIYLIGDGMGFYHLQKTKNERDIELTMDDFEIVNGEENWSGLRKVLVDSDMDSKDEVIAIIDDTRLTNDQKKFRIKGMNAGKVWNDMLKKIYPHLRSARYLSVFYDSVEDNTVQVINDANALLREGRYRPAYDLVMTVKDDDRAFNTIGVALMMQAKFEEAMPWFEKALKAGDPSAQANINGINAEYQHEEELRKELEETLKKYE